jgi:oligoendopeptidase F
MGNEGAKWDLGALYASSDELQAAIEASDRAAAEFEARYKGRLGKLSPSEFGECIAEFEAVSQQLAKYMSYASLKFSADADEGGFYARCQNSYVKSADKLLFFEIEYNSLPKPTQKSFAAHDERYAYFLQELAREKPHQLPLKTESVLIKKEQTGASAFARLFDESFSNMRFRYGGKKLSEEEILALLHSPDRPTRRNAAKAFTKELSRHQKLLAYIYNMIRQDARTECEVRRYKNAEEERHIENRITQKSVDALIKTAEGSFNLVSEYYDKKRALLGLEELYDYDRYAPLSSADEEFGYDECKRIVLETFGAFSPEFARIARKAFDERWIDVYPRAGKRGGAFSHGVTPDAHPYVLLNHTDRRRDLFTLAHELGHAIHQYLSRPVGYLASDTPLTTAETASVFAEMLVFDEMKKRATPEARRAMLSSKLEDIFATLYRQINFTTFERAVHAKDGELGCEEFDAIWMRESVKMFGESVHLTSEYRIWWSYIPHFIHTPFYCYAYAYGQLLVLALFGLYKSGEMGDFAERYVKFLSAGGSKSPRELVGAFGFDIDDEKFWRIGLGEVRKLLDEFKEL